MLLGIVNSPGLAWATVCAPRPRGCRTTSRRCDSRFIPFLRGPIFVRGCIMHRRSTLKCSNPPLSASIYVGQCKTFSSLLFRVDPHPPHPPRFSAKKQRTRLRLGRFSVFFFPVPVRCSLWGVFCLESVLSDWSVFSCNDKSRNCARTKHLKQPRGD